MCFTGLGQDKVAFQFLLFTEIHVVSSLYKIKQLFRDKPS